jgi:hypothetical protein
MPPYYIDYTTPATSAFVDIVTSTNVTWLDAFQFGTPGDTSWSFSGQNFRLDIKGNKDQTVPLLSLTSGAGQIVVSDNVNRILHMNVPESTIVAVLVPGRYLYDLIMFDAAVPANRVALMHGQFRLSEGITGG